MAKAFATSLAANGLACFLIALAGHGGKVPGAPAVPAPPVSQGRQIRSANRQAEKVTKLIEAEPVPVPVAQFVDQAIVAKTGAIRVVDIYTAYRDWCSETNSLAMDLEGFVKEFAEFAIDQELESSNPQDPRIHGIGFKKTMKAA